MVRDSNDADRNSDEYSKSGDQGGNDPKFIFNDLMVDILGGLVPGVVFTLSVMLIILSALHALLIAGADQKKHIEAASWEVPGGDVVLVENFLVTEQALLDEGVDQNVEPPAISSYIAFFLRSAKGTPNMIWVSALVFFLMFSYVLGHLFYRSDPKIPDQLSFMRLRRREWSKVFITNFGGRNRRMSLQQIYESSSNNVKSYLDHGDEWFQRYETRSRKEYRESLTNEKDVETISLFHDNHKWLRQRYGCDNKSDCQFPYPYLYSFLESRGHDHLVPMIHYKGNRLKRSKTLVNMLKIRMQFHCPRRNRVIIRNEAHVRLTTSSWYVARVLTKLCIGAIFVISILILSYIFRWVIDYQSIPPVKHVILIVKPLLIPTTALGISSYAIRNAERYLHYQRLREVFYILEMAYTAFHKDPEMLNMP